MGQFKNAGRSWKHEPVEVNDHDFRSQAMGMAVAYGIYELLLNRGTVYVGTNTDTAELATDAIAHWWCWDIFSVEQHTQATAKRMT